MKEKRLSRAARGLQGVIVSIPCFVLAGTLMASWIDPMSIDDGRWVRFGVAIMVLEFILVHSGAMMNSMLLNRETESWKMLLMLLAFYSLFGGSIALAFKSWELLLIFMAVMLTRSISLVTDPDTARTEAQHRAGLSIVFYLLAVFSSVFVPFPELGVTSSIVYEVYPDRGAGLWEKDPERALAAGVIYFTLLAITEIMAGFREPGKVTAKVAEDE